jgi:hypothetical protein
MNHWLAEELTWQTYDERERELKAFRSQVDFGALQVRATFTNRVALKLSDWLIASGEGLRRRHERTTSVSYPVHVRKFAR